MKTHIKYFSSFFIILFLIIGHGVLAQSGKSTPEDRAQRWDSWMKENLGITPDQEERIHTINLKYAQQNESLRSSTGGRREKLQQLKATDQKKDGDLKSVLSKEQFALYQDRKKEFQKQMMENLKN